MPSTASHGPPAAAAGWPDWGAGSTTHNTVEVQQRQAQRFADARIMDAQDIADTVSYIVTRPRYVAINEVPIRPTQEQA